MDSACPNAIDTSIPKMNEENVKYIMLVSIESYITLTDLRLRIPLDSQILPALDIFNHQSLFVGQVQQANEPVRSGDVSELIFGVDV